MSPHDLLKTRKLIEEAANKHDLRLKDLTPHFSEDVFHWKNHTNFQNNERLAVMLRPRIGQLGFVVLHPHERRFPVRYTDHLTLSDTSVILVTPKCHLHLSVKAIFKNVVDRVMDESKTGECYVCFKPIKTGYMIFNICCRGCSATKCYLCFFKEIRFHINDLNHRIKCDVCRSPNDLGNTIFQAYKQDPSGLNAASRMSSDELKAMQDRMKAEYGKSH